jgi:hypothetical protein
MAWLLGDGIEVGYFEDTKPQNQMNTAQEQ